ncbi:hypothetical protein CRYUN_Cryun31cG0056000 [Craigia yunnanensis]
MVVRDDKETCRIARRDMVVACYTSKSESTRYNKSIVSEQVKKEVTTCEILQRKRVGNSDFRDELGELGVKTLRVVIKHDLVPRMPGIVFNESLLRFDDITGTLECIYTLVGTELRLDVSSSPYLKSGFNPLGFHSLETYLHLIDGFLSTDSEFRSDSLGDIALVNKACDMLVDELRIPHFWYQQANKGLVCNEHDRWFKPRRDPEDIPSPIGEACDLVLKI